MEPHERRSIYLLVAQSALLEGRAGTARSAAAAAIKLSSKPDDDEARANVYFGAATVASEDYDLGVKALKSADPFRLPAKDAAIRASALEIADLIRSHASLLDASDPADLTGDSGRIEKTLNDAARSLAASEDLLHRSVK
jgi:chemotaxis protein MotC